MADSDHASTASLQQLQQLNDDAIASFKSKSDWYRRRYFLTAMSTLILSVATTVLAGWKFPVEYSTTVSNGILVLSALNTLSTGWGFFFSPKESWKISEQTLNRLRALQATIALGLHGTDGATTHAAACFYAYQDILARHNEAWRHLRFKDGGDLPRTVT